MRSAPKIDDRTAKARIRDAAIACIADQGLTDTTARKVAEIADVSPGLVMHHFGSMDGLRLACDEHVTELIRHQKEDALSAGPSIDVLAALRDAQMGPLIGYLAEVLREDSPAVAKLVDELVDDAEGYFQEGIETGMLEPTANPRGRAVVLAIWSFGALVLHRHLERMLGVDLTDPAIGSDPAFAAYAAPVYEILGGGILTEAAAANVQGAMAQLAETNDKEGTS
ncbi:MAG: TetR family transcriptional regulator [Actinomycetota bacterium]